MDRHKTTHDGAVSDWAAGSSAGFGRCLDKKLEHAGLQNSIAIFDDCIAC